jgi:TetR/AcrR family transcriptional repressor of nem operon
MRHLALAKGFPATTVDEICARAGVTKGSFYHHFGAKDDLGLAALQAYFDDLVAAFTGGDWAQAEDPVVRLHQFVAHAADVCVGPVMVNGCLLGSFTLDLAESSPDVRKHLSTMFGALRDMVAGLITDAAAHRRRTVDATGLADHFLAVAEGSILLAKAHADPALPRHSVEHFGAYVDLLLDPPAASGSGSKVKASRPSGSRRR